MIKQMDEDQIIKISELQRERSKRTGSVSIVRENKEKSNLRKAKSVSYSHQLSPQ